jgi:hypothetical protein
MEKDADICHKDSKFAHFIQTLRLNPHLRDAFVLVLYVLCILREQSMGKRRTEVFVLMGCYAALIGS